MIEKPIPAQGPEDIKLIIRMSGETYDSLAEEIGVTPQAISQVVLGHTRSATARYALAMALGLEVVDLWPETEATPTSARAR